MLAAWGPAPMTVPGYSRAGLRAAGLRALLAAQPSTYALGGAGQAERRALGPRLLPVSGLPLPPVHLPGALQQLPQSDALLPAAPRLPPGPARALRPAGPSAPWTSDCSPTALPQLPRSLIRPESSEPHLSVRTTRRSVGTKSDAADYATWVWSDDVKEQWLTLGPVFWVPMEKQALWPGRLLKTRSSPLTCVTQGESLPPWPQFPHLYKER